MLANVPVKPKTSVTVKKTRYEKQQEKKIKKLTSSPAKVGDRVKLIGSRQPGEIIEIKKDQFLLAIGALTTWTTRDKFIPAESLHGIKVRRRAKPEAASKNRTFLKRPTRIRQSQNKTAPPKRKRRRNRAKTARIQRKRRKKKRKSCRKQGKTEETQAAKKCA